MKKFLRSLAGKTIIFILCVCSLCATTLGVVQIILTYMEKYYGKRDIEVGFLMLGIPLKYLYIGSIGALLLSIVFYITLMYLAGRRQGIDEPVPGPLAKVPFEVILAPAAIAAIGVINLLRDFRMALALPTAIAAYVVGLVFFLGISMSVANRLKRHAFIKGTLIYMILVLLKKLLLMIGRLLKKYFVTWKTVIQKLPLIAKTAIGLVGISFIEFLGIAAAVSYNEYEAIVFLWFLEKLILVPLILCLALMLRKLQKGGIALAEGDLSYVTETKGLIGDFKKHGENLNSIALVMNRAVEERLRSERMKTELITNVSHDIKTPLTSIINYATLIADEGSSPEHIKEYSDVLVRQSEKLKRLTEDIVEASKAATGNLEIIPAPCEASVFVTQVSGEYEEKLRASYLTLITKLPETELRIMVDGRRMWRIFDNLMNNICKYSLPSTRVYLSLERLGNKAVFSFKNTSREQLDIPTDELLERFTRGDASRNTEGNGLGLSIAKSLTDLQGGTLDLTTDGDLFKVALSFPVIM
ncbi:MAG: sensor histidine kinase [Lachnospiraceae bacterium]|nr:sensor histidine kinase [Lachnospiraceae bacterium]